MWAAQDIQQSPAGAEADTDGASSGGGGGSGGGSGRGDEAEDDVYGSRWFLPNSGAFESDDSSVEVTTTATGDADIGVATVPTVVSSRRSVF